MKKRWELRQPDIHAVNKIQKSLKCNPIIAEILVNRNIVTEDSAKRFLSASLNHVRPPFAIKDMDAAVIRIYDAIMRREKILIFGDYDVDGITATTLLLEFFQYIGANVIYYIPHRSKEGYGLQVDHIFDVACPNHVNLIITADCGSTSHDAVQSAVDAGIDTIITDHHKVPLALPPSKAVVNPKRPDCTAGFDDLAGVGVAYSLLVCLRKYLREKNFWQSLPEPNLKRVCDLVSLGTVADMVPLVEENRVFTKAGIEMINSKYRTGLNALTELCGIDSDSLEAQDISFKLAPRLNAAGRVAHASTAVDLLRATDFKTANFLARSLNNMNMRRQEIETQILGEIDSYIEQNPHHLERPAIVLSHPNWNVGILGIVASRIVDRYFRPVVLISTESGIGKGSARSIPGIDLYGALGSCERYLERFGGHSLAAGLSIKIENLEQFQKQFENAVLKSATADDFVHKVSIDRELDFKDISPSLMDEMEALKPFGEGNPEPIFSAKDVQIMFSKIVGENHRRMILRQISPETEKTFNAIQFNVDPRLPLAESLDQIAFRLRWNYWNGEKTAQIVIVETE
jgi:single-stranded-DNA-specific exonuclease